MPSRYALLVGIDRYLNDASRTFDNEALSLKNLGGCVNDVETINKFLIDYYKFDKIVTLVSPLPSTLLSAEFRKTSNRLPSYEEIKSEFDMVIQQAKKDDFFYFHFSGHGARLMPIDASPEDHTRDPALLTVDYCRGQLPIRGWQLNSWLQTLTEKGVNIAVSLDSCHSGGALRDEDGWCRTPVDWPSSVPNLPIDESVSRLKHASGSVRRDAELENSWHINPEGFALMAACEQYEKAAEININGRRVGAFTHELFRNLMESRSKTYRIIRDQVKEQLRDRVERQSPVCHGHVDLLFFETLEPVSTAAVVPRVKDGQLILPVGRAHGVHRGSEFTLFPAVSPFSLVIETVDDFECRVQAPEGFLKVWASYLHTLVPQRWHFGDVKLQVFVDTTASSVASQSLSEKLRQELLDKVASEVEVTTSGEVESARAFTLQVSENEATILAPGTRRDVSTEAVRPLELSSGQDLDALAKEAGLALVHLARFQQVLSIREWHHNRGGMKPPPFKFSIQPWRTPASPDPYDEGQPFEFRLERIGKAHHFLFLTVLWFSPEYRVYQLYPVDGEPFDASSGAYFKFRLKTPSAPQNIRRRLQWNSRRDVLRVLVTEDESVSWKGLELPNLWDADKVWLDRGKGKERREGEVFVDDIQWWAYDTEIISNSTHDG